MSFRTFEHTADVGIEVESDTIEGLFQDAARGLFHVVRGDNRVARARVMPVAVQGRELRLALLEFLESFIFLQDAEGLVFDDVDEVRVEHEGDAWHVSARVHGEPFSHDRHPGALQVKAVTRHELDVEPPMEGRGARARVLFDI